MSTQSRDELREHEFDGIQEYDNPLPGWWKGLFWATFVFAVGYFVHYQLTDKGLSVADEYALEMKEHRAQQQALAAAAGEVSEDSLVALMNDGAAVKEGASKYAAVCAACHADKGQGLVGPNLTDGHWIHGAGKLTDIFKVVDEGVLAKAMPAWGKQLKPDELRKVVAYVGTLRNTNVAGKPPEGNPAGATAGQAVQ